MDVPGGNGESAGNAFGDFLPADLNFAVVAFKAGGVGGGNVLFNPLAGGLADGDAVLLTDIFGDGAVKAVAAGGNGLSVDKPAQR